MSDQKITNEMLYELLQDFKSDVNRRFDEADRRFEDFKTDVNRRFDEERHAREKMEHKLEKIYESRHEVEARVTWRFIWQASAVNVALLIVLLSILRIAETGV